jgi:hypothetical protein
VRLVCTALYQSNGAVSGLQGTGEPAVWRRFVIERCIALLGLLLLAAPAAAQSTYVGASLVGDIVRLAKVDYDESETPRILGDLSVDGEAIGFNVKVGRAFTERWGLEFEFARSGEFESSFPEFLPALTPERLVPTLPGTVVSIPAFDLDVDSERRHLSMSAVAFVRQNVGERIELSFLGGVAFNRFSTSTSYNIDIRRLAIYPPIVVDGIRTIEYHTGPTVGAEVAFKLTDAAAITGGARLHAVTISGRSGWLIRPNVGMRWQF